MPSTNAVRIVAESLPLIDRDIVAIAPTPDDGVVIVWSGGALQAFDDELQPVSERSEIDSPSGCCAQSAAIDAEGRVFLAVAVPSEALDGHGEREPAPAIVRYDLQSGSVAGLYAFARPPMVGAIAAGNDGVIAAFGSSVVRLDAETGHELARFDGVDGTASMLSVSSEHVLASTGRDRYLLDARTLAPNSAAHDAMTTRAALAGGHAWLVRDGGLFRAGEGTAPQQVELGHEIRSFASSGDYLWLHLGSAIVVLDGETGQEIGRSQLEGGRPFGAMSARGRSMWLEHPEDRTVVRYEMERDAL